MGISTMDALTTLFAPQHYIPHGHCYLWQTNLVSLHIAADTLIAVAYYSIPVMLIYFVSQRDDVPFRRVFLLFGAFIVSCGTTHVTSIWTLWHPAYWLEGTLKAITALISIYTALALWSIIPQALALPKPEQLQQINQELASQVQEREQAEAALQQQLDFDRLISSISTRFINLGFDAMDMGIEQALEEIAQFTQVDTSYIMRLSDEGDRFSMTHEWVADHYQPKQKEVQQVPLALFPWATQQLQAGHVLYVPDLEQLPHEAKLDRQNWQQFNLTSLVGVPLIFQETILGWVGFASFSDQKQWPDSHLQLLKIFGEILTNALQRQMAEWELLQLNQDLERHVAERTAALQKSEQRVRSLLENVRLVVVGLDGTGRIDYINPWGREVMGYEETEILGRNWFDFCIPRHEASAVKQVFEDELAQDAHDRTYYENPVLTKTGKERLIAWNNTVLRDTAGARIGTMSIGEDITERYAIQRMKDEFISVVSHELRTPLTSIHGALELLSAGILPLDSERGQHVLSIAADNSTRLVRLVNDILELERLESGKIKLEIQTVLTSELTERARELMEVLAERSQVSLKISDPGLELQVDSDRIIQVLTNLLDNAIKFSEAESEVILSVNIGLVSIESPGQPRQALFRVKDQGRGIPATQLEHIFERFQQVDASDSRRKGGTGLGLAICRSIVHQHGGRIWVESHPGQGSCFFFTIPLKYDIQG